MTAQPQDTHYPTPVPAENRSLAHIPGDYGAPLIGHTFSFLRNPLAHMDMLYRRYGEVCRGSAFFHRAVNLISADGNQFVLLDRDGNFSSFLGWAPVLHRLFPRGLMLRDGHDHRYHRRLMQPAFRKEALADYVDRMNPEIAVRIRDWGGRGWFRFYPTIKQLTLDLAANVFLGEDLGGERDRLNRAFVDAVAASLAVVRYPIPGGAMWRGVRGRRVLADWLRARIPERRRGHGTDFFTQLCQARSEEGDSYSDQEIIDHMIFLMMAAHDTTTSSLSSMVYALGRYPEWQEQLREDCRATGREQIPHAELDRLERVEWVFNEILRLIPPVISLPRRATRDCEFAGYRIPANTIVNVFPAYTHRMPEYWTEPHRFDPERFSKARAEHKRHPFAWVPFGGGAHMCIGRHFAEVQVKALVHQLLLSYRIRLPRDYEMPVQLAPIAKPKDGLPVRFETL